MAKKTTLAELGKLLKSDDKKGDTSFWGVVKSVNTDSSGKVTSYNVSLGGESGTVKCRKLAGAKVNDTVLVTLRSTGEAVVVGTKNGDTDASDAQTTAETAQTTADAASKTFTTATVAPPYKEGDTWVYTSGSTEIRKVCVVTKTTGTYAASDWEDMQGAENNYFWYDTDGAHVSLAEKSTTDVKNVLVNSSGMEVKDGDTVLASLAGSLVEIGKSAISAFIRMCQNIVYISGTYDNTNVKLNIGMNNSGTKDKFIYLSTLTESQWQTFYGGDSVPYAMAKLESDLDTDYTAELNATNGTDSATISIYTDNGGSYAGMQADDVKLVNSDNGGSIEISRDADSNDIVDITADEINLNGDIGEISGLSAIFDTTTVTWTLSSSHSEGTEVTLSDKTSTNQGYYPLAISGMGGTAFRFAGRCEITSSSSGSCTVAGTGPAAGGSMSAGRNITAEILWIKE